MKMELRKSAIDRIEQAIETEEDGSVREVLRDCYSRAAAFDRSSSPLVSLSHVVIACTDIRSGKAAALARELGEYENRLATFRPTVNSKSVNDYVRARELADRRAGLGSEWSGPRDSTIRRSSYLHDYVCAVRDSLTVLKSARPRSSDQRIAEIIETVPSTEDRQDLRMIYLRLTRQVRDYEILRKSILTECPEVRILGDGGVVTIESRPPAQEFADEEQKTALASLANKLQDNDQLRHFGLRNEEGRILTILSDAQLLDRKELAAILKIVREVLS